MTGRHDTAATMAWMREGTAHLRRCADKLDDAAFPAPSLLPGWTRAHVLGHVARNAEALTRLATWARTGVQTPMYANPEQRAAETENSAAQRPATLRAELLATAGALDAVLDALTPQQWQAQVRSALGRATPAAEIPWMRIREVWLHAIDLGAGATVADLPDGVVDLHDNRLDLAKEAGATHVVNGGREDLTGTLMSITGGAGVSDETARIGG